MSQYQNACPTPPGYTCSNCWTTELGGVRSIWLQDVNFTFSDIQDPNEWATAVCNGHVRIFTFTTGSVTIDANSSTGYGNQPTQVDSFTYTVEFHDPQLVVAGSASNGNLPFWDFVRNGAQWLVGYRTGSQIWLSSIAAQFTSTVPVQADIKSKMDIDVKAMFVQSHAVMGVAEPIGVFDSCLDC